MNGFELRQHRSRLRLSQAKLAELTGVSQHALSAFELEKASLSLRDARAIERALADSGRVSRIAGRRKRYRVHEFVKAVHSPERIARATKTLGNAEYLRALASLHESHRTNKKDGPVALGLFSGCGGFSLGFSAAGFCVRGFVELEPELRSIYAANFPHADGLGGDVALLDDKTVKKWSTNVGEVEVIIGGPPCQGFSLSGKRDVADPRNKLFKHYMRMVDCLQPKIAVMENVRLLTSMRAPNNALVKDLICNDFRRRGYSVAVFGVNAMNYGVPQHRERVFFVAVRQDCGFPPSIPNETHGGDRDLFGASVLPLRTFGDACSDLTYLESGEKSEDPLHEAVAHPAHVIDWLWNVQEGASAHDNEDASKRPPSGYNTTYKRQVWSEPASTVQTTFGMISGCRNVHPIATRSLTVREAARIQSFPDEFVFPGKLGAIRTGIGNAVPPLLAFQLGQHLLKALNLVEVANF